MTVDPRVCARAGCGKVAHPQDAYCSRACIETALGVAKPLTTQQKAAEKRAAKEAA